MVYFDLNSNTIVNPEILRFSTDHALHPVGFIQGKNTCYYISFRVTWQYHDWQCWDPGATVDNGIPLFTETSQHISWCKVFDEENQRIWVYDTGVSALKGFALNGTSRTVSVAGLTAEPPDCDPYNPDVWHTGGGGFSLYLLNERFVTFTGDGAFDLEGGE